MCDTKNQYSMKFLRNIAIYCLIFIGSSAYADHFVGYDMALVNIKNPNGTPTDTYKWVMKIFRDVNGIPIPNSATFQIYTPANVSVGTFTCTKINPQTFLTYPPEECPPAQAQLAVEVGVYESPIINYSSLNNTTGYFVSSSSCCRNIGIVNVPAPSWSYGITFTMDFPRLNAGSPTRYNSSPEFKKNPLTFFCVGKPYTLNWLVTDPDGDSLVFSLAQPLDDGPGTKPFDLIPYEAGYNLNYNIIDGVPDLTINPSTGIINFIPTRAGKYLVAFKVDEYRKISGVPTKIGSIRREYQLEVVVCPEAPPVTEDNNNQKKVIVDTINFPNEYTITFTSRDTPLDSLFMYILPNINPGENLLNPNTFNGKWGEIGSLTSGTAAQNLIIAGQTSIVGQFNWKPKCDAVRDKPYTFTVVARDKTCPSPFYDSTFVTLYVKKKDNIKPLFANKYHTQPDTVRFNTSINKKTKRYYVNAGETFQLNGDSIIKTYDKDSSQVVQIIMQPDAYNPGTANGRFVFSATPGTVHSTAIFRWDTRCEDMSDTSYKVKFIAFDDDCKKRDSVDFSIEIFIRDQPNQKPRFSIHNIDTIRIPEGTTDSIIVAIYDTIPNFYNRFRHITLLPDLTDFSFAQGTGGSPLIYTQLDGPDSLKVKFTWSPSCANVRSEPYKLIMRTIDEACPTLFDLDTIFVYATGPFNSAPEFRDKNDITYNIVDTTIYGGDIFKFNLYAVDTNQRFDSVYITLDQTSEIANPTIVDKIAFVIPSAGKDSSRTELYWDTDCKDIRTTPYTARVMARDNECVNPEKQILTFNITVRERPNFLPKFIFTNATETVDTLYAGETLNINLTVLDTTIGEIITLDTISTNIPFNLPRPTIARTTGIGADTVKTLMNWFADCSLIRTEPYIINIASWDGACRNPQDSARHTFKIYILPNPDLFPSFTLGKDTVIELVAGEKFELELNSKSVLPGDSILIGTTGDVYSGIPGNWAVFEQTSASGEGTATFKWNTSCDQIRDSAYNVFFTTANPPCQTPTTGFNIKFKVIPNTDVISKIPNVFSPNNDGVNDVYSIIKQYKVYCDPGFKFTIFNRWGKIVFESTNPEFQWNAEGLGSGTYFYTLESRARSQNGTIDIIK